MQLFHSEPEPPKTANVTSRRDSERARPPLNVRDNPRVIRSSILHPQPRIRMSATGGKTDAWNVRETWIVAREAGSVEGDGASRE